MWSCRLHDVEPQEGLEMMPPVTLSRLVVGKAMRTVPYPVRALLVAQAVAGVCTDVVLMLPV